MRNIAILWKLMAGQRLRYLAAIAALIVATSAMYLGPFVGRATIDHIVKGEPLQAPQPVREFVASLGGRSVLAHNLWVATLALVGVTAIGGTFTYLKGRWAATASEGVSRRLRLRLYDHMQHLPARFFDNRDTGDLVQRCSSDVETLRMFLAMQVTEVGRALIMVGVGIPVMLSVSTYMTGVAMILLVPIVGYSVLFFLRVKRVFKQADEAEGLMTARLQENVSGIRVVRAFARGRYESDRFAETNQEYRTHWFRLVKVLAAFWSVSDLMCLSQVALVLFVGAWRVRTGHLSIGSLFAFVTFVNMFLWPIRYMGRILADFGKAMVALGRIHEVLDETREDGKSFEQSGLVKAGPPEHIEQTDEFTATGQIAVEGLSFTHSGGFRALDNVHFEISAGTTLAILGPSGSGKSTLVSLLLRLYDYTEGTIRLDGRELHELSHKTARRQFGTVLQDPFLYSRTVKENIRLGGAEVTDDDIAEAARIACVHDAIESFQQGYETVVGEKGVMLSGGQRQRVALARAILADPPILLLDDALSAVDTRTEGLILRALRQRHGRRTTIVIAHRLSTLRRADRILVFEHGRVVQDGTHDELLARTGPYRRLWDIQTSIETDYQQDIQAAATSEKT